MRASFVLPLVMMVVWSSYDPYPWCAVYGGSWSGTSNCGFKTFHLATVVFPARPISSTIK